MMLGTINHIAIAVPDLALAAAQWGARTGASVSPPQSLPEHGVTVVFVDVPGNRIELLEPLGDDSPIAKFLERNPPGIRSHTSSTEENNRGSDCACDTLVQCPSK